MPLDSLKRLEPWIPKPFVQNAVLDFMRTAPGPMFMREVCDGVGLDKYAVNLALQRLTRKRVLTRYKIPAQQPGNWNNRVKQMRPGGVTRATYLYSYVPEGSE